MISLEPQGSAQRYSMGAIWGLRYNISFSRDVTNEWGM